MLWGSEFGGYHPSLILVEYEGLVGPVQGEEQPAGKQVLILLGRQCMCPHICKENLSQKLSSSLEALQKQNLCETAPLSFSFFWTPASEVIYL